MKHDPTLHPYESDPTTMLGLVVMILVMMAVGFAIGFGIGAWIF